MMIVVYSDYAQLLKSILCELESGEGFVVLCEVVVLVVALDGAICELFVKIGDIGIGGQNRNKGGFYRTGH